MDKKQCESRSTRSTSAYNSNRSVKDYASVIQKPLKQHQSNQPESQICSRIFISILNGNIQEAMDICHLLGKLGNSDLKRRTIQFIQQHFLSINRKNTFSNKEKSQNRVDSLLQLQDDLQQEIGKLNQKKDQLIKQNESLLINNKIFQQKIRSQANKMKEEIQVLQKGKQSKITLLNNQLKDKEQVIRSLSINMKKQEDQINIHKTFIQHERHQRIRLNEKKQKQIIILRTQLNQNMRDIKTLQKICQDKQNQIQNVRNQLEKVKYKMKQSEKPGFPSVMDKSFEKNSQSNNYLNLVVENSRLEESFVQRDVFRELNLSKIKQKRSESKIYNIQKQYQQANTIISQQQEKINSISAKNGALENQLEQWKQKHEELSQNYINSQEKIQKLDKIYQQSQQELLLAKQELKQTKDNLHRYRQQLDFSKIKIRELSIKDQKNNNLLQEDKAISSQIATGKVTSSEIVIYLRNYLKALTHQERNQLQQKLKKII